MMRTRHALAGALAGLVAGTGAAYGADADLASNPYQGIIERNVFHLNPPPPPPEPPAIKQPPPKIFLTGISTLRGMRKAMLKTAPTAGKPGEAPKEHSYVIREGETMDGLEVLAINEKDGVVKIKNGEEMLSLNFKDNAVATAAAPAAAPMPGAPPGLMPGAPGPKAPPPAETPAPRNAFRTALRAANGGGGPFSGGAGGGLGVSLGASAPAAEAPLAVPTTAEEQAVLVELNREIHKGNPDMAPFPPTVLSEGLDAANHEATVGPPGARVPGRVILPGGPSF